ncbi:MAG TPA: hypothetical protein VJB67_01360 [Patescibacteria group bacterium]|nr:hypothetical protein [Patescibacteria group bacterium]
MPTKAQKQKIDKTIDSAKNFGTDMVGKLKTLKKKYDGLDDDTKKKILAGLASVAAVIATIKTAKKVKKSIKKKK